MSEPFKEVVTIDRVVHEPARLAILMILEVCADADFKYLQSLTGLSTSNLSLHLTKLETHGLIAIDKTFVRKTPRTVAKLTTEGKAALRESGVVSRNRSARRTNGRCCAAVCCPNRQEVKTMARRSYQTISSTLRVQDIAEIDRIAGMLRDEGWDYSNRSFVMRAACVCLSDALRGKASNEVLRYFITRRAQRPPRPS